tara:strand:+ start:451 stop:576 length:126 start_codon:yes stop_codon:yes gene_type:complete
MNLKTYRNEKPYITTTSKDCHHAMLGFSNAKHYNGAGNACI